MRDIVEVDAFTAAVSVIENGDPAIAENFDPAYQALSNRTHYLNERRDELADRIDADELYLSPKARILPLDPMAFRPTRDSEWSVSSSGSDPSVGLRWSTSVLGAQLVLPLNRLIPQGATDIVIDMMVDPAVHVAPSTLALYSTSPIYSIPSVNYTGPRFTASTSGSSLQVLTCTLTGITMGNSATHKLVFTVGQVSSTTDVIEGGRIRYNDPGPRND